MVLVLWLRYLALVGWDSGPFSYAQDKPGGGGGLAVLAVQIGVVNLESLAVKPAAVDVLPAGPPAVPLEGFGPLVHHRALELVGKGFGLGLQLRNHGPDVNQVLCRGVDLLNTHCIWTVKNN